MDKVFFNSWESLGRIALLTVLSYATIVLLLRISGKRTLSKMNPADFIVTLALGSTLSTMILNKDVPLLDGALAFAMLILLQYIVTWLSVHVPMVKKTITSDPVLLVYQGQVLEEVMTQQRVKIEEIYLSARERGISDISEIGAAVLETTGSITVISQVGSAQDSALEDVQKGGLKGRAPEE